MRKLLLPAAAICLCLSCAPPFDLGFSSAAVILGKMTEESRIGPLSNYYTGYYSSTPAFYPEKTATGVDASRGFYLTTDAGSSIMVLGFAAPNGFGGYLSFNTLIGSLYHADPSYPRFAAAPVKTGDTTSILYLDSASPSSNFFENVGAVPASQTFTFGATTSFSSLVGYGTPPQALGACIAPSPTALDSIYFLMLDTATGQYHDGMAGLDSSGMSGFVDLYGAQTFAFIPAGTSRVLYYHDPVANVSYASFSVNGSWQCWKWWVDGAGFHEVQLSSVTARIDALLTTGELFSTQDGIGRVYDSNGKKVASFPLGNLQLAYEEYVNGTPRVFFSMPIPQDQGQLSLRVYSIPTSQLDSLSF